MTKQQSQPKNEEKQQKKKGIVIKNKNALKSSPKEEEEENLDNLSKEEKILAMRKIQENSDIDIMGDTFGEEKETNKKSNDMKEILETKPNGEEEFKLLAETISEKLSIYNVKKKKKIHTLLFYNL